MDATIKARWIEALRSGKYQQGRGQLKTGDNTYCCLGVLRCVMKGDFASKRFEEFFLSYEEQRTWGLTRDDQHELSNRNDGCSNYRATGPQSFAQIADYIEANL